jgi:hypothetical protein
VHWVALLVETMAECNGADIDLMRKNFACELPYLIFRWVAVVVIELEKTDRPVGIGTGEIFTIMCNF